MRCSTKNNRSTSQADFTDYVRQDRILPCKGNVYCLKSVSAESTLVVHATVFTTARII